MVFIVEVVLEIVNVWVHDVHIDIVEKNNRLRDKNLSYYLKVEINLVLVVNVFNQNKELVNFEVMVLVEVILDFFIVKEIGTVMYKDKSKVAKLTKSY